MKIIYFIIALVVILGALYFYGSTAAETCVSIGECKKCWKSVEVTVQRTSDGLCNSDICAASPADQQNNAMADLYLCVCEKERTNGFSNTAENEQLKSSIKAYTGYDIDAQNFCSQPGLIITKRSYG